VPEAEVAAVLDASALMAVLHDEDGADEAAALAWHWRNDLKFQPSQRTGNGPKQTSPQRFD